jgi:hypothetical protein
MGMVYADIELINGGDLRMARRCFIGEEEVRRTHVMMLADTRAFSMVINERIQAQLGLPFFEKRLVQLSDDKVMECDVVGPVDVRFANRMATCSAYVLPGDGQPILGGIPMLEMNVVIDQGRQELVVNPVFPHYSVIK